MNGVTEMESLGENSFSSEIEKKGALSSGGLNDLISQLLNNFINPAIQEKGSLVFKLGSTDDAHSPKDFLIKTS